MSAPAFTPGPWRDCDPGSNFHKGKKFIRPRDSETLIATVSGERRFAEVVANARLIAAAPGLYDVAATLERLAGMSTADLVAAVTEDPSLLTTIIETAAEEARAARGEP